MICSSFGRTRCDQWGPAGDHGRSESAAGYSAGEGAAGGSGGGEGAEKQLQVRRGRWEEKGGNGERSRGKREGRRGGKGERR